MRRMRIPLWVCDIMVRENGIYYKVVGADIWRGLHVESRSAHVMVSTSAGPK